MSGSTNPTLSLEIDDNMSAGADAATAALSRIADAADNVSASITKAGPSFDVLLRKADPAVGLAERLAIAQRNLARDTATADAALAAGNATLEQRNAVVDKASARVQALTAATVNAGPATNALADANGKAAAAASGASMAHAGFTREIVILGHEIVTGNFSRVPGSMMVLAERSGELNNIVKTLGGLIFGLPGAALAAAAGLAYMGYEAEHNQRQLLSLQTALRATRDDFTAMASEANAAAKLVAGSTGFNLADSRAASQSFASVSAFTGSADQLAALVREAGDLAIVTGETLPVAAAKLAAAMNDPAKLAQEWADTHSFGMTQAIADQIKVMQEGGDKAAAFAADLDALKSKTQGVADQSKTGLQIAIEDLGKAFRDTGSDGKSFADSIGKGMQNVAITAVEQIAEIIRAMESAREFLAHPFGGNTSGVSTASSNQIYSIAEANNYGGNVNTSAAQADLAVKIAKQESGGQQFNNDGTVKTSAQGALGEFQLMPSTAAGLGVDPTNTEQNISGGLQYIAQLWSKYGGDPTLVAMAYNWGPGNVDKFLAGKKSIADVPAETKAYVQSVSGKGVDTIPTFGAVDVTGMSPDKNGIANTGLIDQAVAKADKANTPIAAALSAGADVKLYTAALAALAAEGDTSSVSVLKLQEALQKAQVTLQDAKTPADNLVDSLERQAAGQDKIAAAYANGMDAVSHATNLVRAEDEARKMAGVTTDNYLVTVLKLTAAYDDLTASQSADKSAAQDHAQEQQIAYLKEETVTLGENADIRARDLAVFKERQALDNTPGLKQQEIDRRLANAAAIADETTNLQRQQQAANEVGNALTQVADQLGQAITTAFVSGQGAAVNWGNVTKAIIASVLQELLKLAVINPIMDSAFGTTKTTAGEVLSLGSMAGASGGGSGGIGSLLSMGSSAYSLSGMVSGGGLFGAGGLLYAGMGAESAAMASAPLGAGIAGPVLPGATAFSGAGLTATTGFAGGIGGGFAIGDILGGAIQRGNGTVGPAPMIGAGLGALGGAGIGFMVGGPVGALVGGLAGGAIGGAGGGLIGPSKASVYGGVALNVDSNGLLQTGISSSQGMDNSANVAQANADVAAVNAFLTANGIQIANRGPGIVANAATPGNANPGGVQWIGAGNTPNDPNFYASLNSANATTGKTEFQNFQFSSANSAVNSALSGQTFTNLAALETAVTNIQTFVNTTEPALIALGASPTANGTLTTQITTLNTEFQAAITQATGLGLATTDLSTAWTAATKAANDAVAAQIAATDSGFTSRYMTAAASISGNPADAQAAQLYAFDTSAATQRTTLDGQLVAIYGDSYKSTAAYADQMAQLEKTLGEERLAIQQSYNDKLAATATTSVTSLASYVLKLQTGTNSPLSSAAQYALAGQQFNADAVAAQAGNWNAYTNLTGYADSLLSSSRTQNGSGAAYAADFNRVLDAISSMAAMTPDTLTASIYATQMQTQTQQLSAGLAAVTAAVNALRQQVGAPARIAA